MSDILTINYFCPACGYSWEDTFSTGAMAGTCQCPNCEEQVPGFMEDC